MSAKMWEVTVEHARTCVLDKKLYLYNASVSQQKNGVVFNVVGQVLGQFSGRQYIPADKLSGAEKGGFSYSFCFLPFSEFTSPEGMSFLNVQSTASCFVPHTAIPIDKA
ncbi:calmodulin-binding 60 A-like isoform X2 [Olea europaea subsp. europaea]|uniref:Calmodulin-binding 60 A-like isoform X2 n=1 Tax=Olea europaea subsp. europaea TaxID=158383 RepID=A0A8S0RPR1_OLEEU|nr:calmodulin-binding 60 A-like isoform X2 [Olea europaea subsp. europaea]